MYKNFEKWGLIYGIVVALITLALGFLKGYKLIPIEWVWVFSFIWVPILTAISVILLCLIIVGVLDLIFSIRRKLLHFGF